MIVGYFSVNGYARVVSKGSPDPTNQRSPRTTEPATIPSNFVENLRSGPRTSKATAAVKSLRLLPGISGFIELTSTTVFESVTTVKHDSGGKAEMTLANFSCTRPAEFISTKVCGTRRTDKIGVAGDGNKLRCSASGRTSSPAAKATCHTESSGTATQIVIVTSTASSRRVGKRCKNISVRLAICVNRFLRMSS